jgi:hypothetical protein
MRVHHSVEIIVSVLVFLDHLRTKRDFLGLGILRGVGKMSISIIWWELLEARPATSPPLTNGFLDT